MAQSTNYNVDGINFVSPVYDVTVPSYNLNADDGYIENIVRKFNNHNINGFVIITVRLTGEDLSDLLDESSDNRRNHLRNEIVSAYEDTQADGVCIDFEFAGQYQTDTRRQRFEDFIEKLDNALESTTKWQNANRNQYFMITVPGLYADRAPEQLLGSEAFRWRILLDYVDNIVIMCYDITHETGEHPEYYVNYCINWARQRVGADNYILGFPTYSKNYRIDTAGRALSGFTSDWLFQDANGNNISKIYYNKLIRNAFIRLPNTRPIQWRETIGENWTADPGLTTEPGISRPVNIPFLEYQYNNRWYRSELDCDNDTVVRDLQLLNNNGLNGIAFWQYLWDNFDDPNNPGSREDRNIHSVMGSGSQEPLSLAVNGFDVFPKMDGQADTAILSLGKTYPANI